MKVNVQERSCAYCANTGLFNAHVEEKEEIVSLPEALSEGERAWIPEINYFRKSEPESGSGDFLAGEINHVFWRDSISDWIKLLGKLTMVFL